LLEDIKEILITEDEIARKVKELAGVLSEEYRSKNPLVICVLKGAAFFMTDLIKQMDIELEMDFMDVSSYGNQTQSSGEVKIIKDLNTTVQGRHVLVVEDIIDSGLTLKYLVDLLHHRKAESVKVVTLLDKPLRRKVAFKPDWVGFKVPDEFVVGYGLDYAERYRNLPFIGVLKPDVYTL
jgi:hypoxanthine phosphoribosyltransferase